MYQIIHTAKIVKCDETAEVGILVDGKVLPIGGGTKATLYVNGGYLYHDEGYTSKVSAAELDSMMSRGVVLKVNHYVYFPTMYEYDDRYGSLLAYMTEDGPVGAITKEADNPS